VLSIEGGEESRAKRVQKRKERGVGGVSVVGKIGGILFGSDAMADTWYSKPFPTVHLPYNVASFPDFPLCSPFTPLLLFASLRETLSPSLLP
jgi:hypothetical protein